MASLPARSRLVHPAVIAKLLGHSDIETTARYTHLVRDSIHEAAERFAGSIAADILQTTTRRQTLGRPRPPH